MKLDKMTRRLSEITISQTSTTVAKRIALDEAISLLSKIDDAMPEGWEIDNKQPFSYHLACVFGCIATIPIRKIPPKFKDGTLVTDGTHMPAIVIANGTRLRWICGEENHPLSFMDNPHLATMDEVDYAEKLWNKSDTTKNKRWIFPVYRALVKAQEPKSICGVCYNEDVDPANTGDCEQENE